jgi:hypothetical protein
MRNKRKGRNTRNLFRVFRPFRVLRRFGLAWNSVRFGETCELNFTHFTNRVG